MTFVKALSISLIALTGLHLVQGVSVGIPTVNFTSSAANGTFSLASLTSIVVDAQFANLTDTDGETLIPPTLSQFAATFASDIQNVTGTNASVTEGSAGSANAIFLTIDDSNDKFVDVAGRKTSEGYSVNVTEDGIVIAGASPLGVWWGTRTILQMAVLNSNEVPTGSAVDAPGWGTRGLMLDIARHFYPATFLIEMCAYMSWWKQNTFHVHLSDNLFVNANYTPEQVANLYSAFRINSPSPSLAGLDKRPDESYTPEVFDDVQTQCASRGVTIIPEIEAPGHALVISQWKPELALPEDASLLNISEPEMIPTMETIWSELLPLFHSKSVHIGADEYDSSLADDYNRFVNTMSDFIQQKSNKTIRIWGTNEPSNTSTVSQNITIQHWEAFEDRPASLIEAGYTVINSDDMFYIVGKFSGSYPQSLNVTRIFHADPSVPGGGPFAPNIFDTTNVTNNLARNEPRIPGEIAAQWNDFGNNATSVLEAYYAWQPGQAALADKQWGGTLTEEDYLTTILHETLHRAAPGQNLDRRIASKEDVILQYDFNQTQGDSVPDQSGNGYDGQLTGGAVVADDGSVQFPTADARITTPLGSKGRPYTLSFSIRPTSSAPGPILTGPDSSLLMGNGSITNVTLLENGNPFSLNYTLPLNVWTDVQLVGVGDVTALSAGNGAEMPFLTRIGVNGEMFVWKNISIVAPLAEIGGFVGFVKDVKLTGSI